MSNREPNSTEPLLPLRIAIHRPGADPDDQVLSQALSGLFRDPASTQAVPDWNHLEATALSLARRRRRRYHLRALLGSIGPLRFSAFAALAALPLFIYWFLWPRQAVVAHIVDAAPQVQTFSEQRDAHVALHAESEKTGARLLCGANLLLGQGHAEVDQGEAGRPRIRLRDGVLAVQVPPLHGGGKLVVFTSDAEIIVHGTRFEVDKRQADATVVSVQEGLVEVRPSNGRRQSVFLRAGEHLTVPTADAYLRQTRQAVEEMVARRNCDDPTGVLDAYLNTEAAEYDTSAALYLKGSCAAGRGERDTALSCFEKVVSGSANQTRADNALARIAQLRTSASRKEGAAAWRRYLERFPQGLHRELALQVLDGPLPPPEPEREGREGR